MTFEFASGANFTVIYPLHLGIFNRQLKPDDIPFRYAQGLAPLIRITG